MDVTEIVIQYIYQDTRSTQPQKIIIRLSEREVAQQTETADVYIDGDHRQEISG